MSSENGDQNGEQNVEPWNPETETMEEFKARTAKKKKVDLRIQVENRTEIEKDKLWNALREKVSKKLKDEGVDISPNDLTSEKEINRYIEIHKKLVERRKQPQNIASEQGSKATGQTPLNAEQLGKSYYPVDLDVALREYPDMESMIEDLKAEAKAGNEQAKKYLQQLMKKQMAQDVKHGTQYEFEGKLKDFRQEVSDSASEEEADEIEEEVDKTKKKWRKVR